MSTQPTGRETMVHGVIACAIAIGAWMLLVEPKIAELTELEQEIAIVRQEQPTVGGMTLEQVGERVVALRQEVAAIRDRNGAAGNSSRWYERITGLAETHGLIVHSVQPGTLMVADDASVGASRIDLSVEGDYADVAAFLDDLTAIAGFLRPTAIHLSPMVRDGTPTVLANFRGEALEFDIPAVLLGMQGDDDAG